MFEPKDAEVFWLGDLDVYIDDETLPAFYTRAEKEIAFSAEFAEFLEGIPQVLVRKDLTRFGMSISLEAMEWTSEIMKLARGGETVTVGGYKYIHYGTDYVEPETHRYRFVGKLVNTKAIEFVMLKGKVEEFGPIPTGGTDYNGIPMTLAALKDPTIADESRNLAHWKIEQ